MRYKRKNIGTIINDTLHFKIPFNFIKKYSELK